ncbi:MAG: hypothetical protein ACREXU_13285, partial [Gammaproteobacteria bacterium]
DFSDSRDDEQTESFQNFHFMLLHVAGAFHDGSSRHVCIRQSSSCTAQATVSIRDALFRFGMSVASGEMRFSAVKRYRCVRNTPHELSGS